MIFNRQAYKQQSGFSLVETLVAITILLIVITGPLSISSQAAKSTSFSSEQVVAFFLAQEGLEIAQKGRDDLILRNFLVSTSPNYLASPWTNQFINQTSSGKFRHCFHTTGCPLEIVTNTTGEVKTPTSNCSTIANCRLHYNESGDRSRYTHTAAVGNPPTPYTRVIRFLPVSGADQIRVTSEVTWRTGSLRQAQRVVVESYLFKVYEDNI